MTDCFSPNRWESEDDTTSTPSADASVSHAHVKPKPLVKKDTKPITSAEEFWDRLGL